MGQSTNPYASRVREVETLWLDGETVSEIARQTNVPEYQVRNLMAEQGHDVADKSRKNQKYLAPLYEALEEGITVKEAAVRIGKPYQSVLRWLRKDGYDTQANYTAERTALMPRVRELYGQGLTVNEVAAKVGKTPVTVSRWLKGEAVEIRPRGGWQGETKRDQHWTAVEQMHAQGATNHAIAQEIGVHSSSVATWLREAGLNPNYSEASVQQQKTRQAQEQVRQGAVQAYLDGGTYEDVAVRFEIDRTTLARWVRREGVTGQGGRAAQDAVLKPEAVRLYVEEDRSIQDICQILGRGFYVVRGWLANAGVEVKTAWERKTPKQRRAMQEAAWESNRGSARGRRK